MVCYVEIKVLKNPVAGHVFGYAVYSDGVAVNTVNAVFGAGGVAIGLNTTATALNIKNWLQSNNSVAGVSYEIDAADATLVRCTYDYDAQVTCSGLVFSKDFVAVYFFEDYLYGYYTPEIRDMSIEIIDTESNERVLQNELAQADSIKIDWDGGDDIFQTVKISSLSFEMYVPDASDAYFIHLLTGNEKRYRVLLKAVANGVSRLIWQGFILPDVYSEPWKSAGVFVKFTASDMLGGLKGVYFKDWYYSNWFNVPVLIAEILNATGLGQMIYIAPMLVNVSNESWLWRYKIYDLENTTGNNKEDLYSILEKILVSEGMSIYSYQGKWFLDGYSRVSGGAVDYEVYYPDGTYKGVESVVFQDINYRWQASPVLTSETPFGTVEMEFSSENSDSIYTDDVMSNDFMLSFCNIMSNEYFATDYDYGYTSSMNMYWAAIGYPYMKYNADWVFQYGVDTAIPVSTNITEAEALNNYLQCTQRASVIEGRKYVLKFSLKFFCRFSTPKTESWVADNLNNGSFDRFVIFVLKIGGIEYLSNRPSNQVVKFVKTIQEVLDVVFTATFDLEYTFTAPVTDDVEFLLLPRVGSLSSLDMIGAGMTPIEFYIKPEESLSDLESVTARRNIGYTKKKSISVGLTCSADSTVKNGYRYGEPFSVSEINVPVEGLTNFFQPQRYTVNNVEYNLILGFQKFTVSDYINILLFATKAKKCFYLIKPDGTEYLYDSIYTRKVSNVPNVIGYRGYVTPTPEYNYKPKLPKDYTVMPLIESGDKFLLRKRLFLAENISERMDWKIYDFPDETKQTYLKTLAYAIHCLRSDVLTKIEGGVFGLVLPHQRISFMYNGALRYYLPTRISLDLFNGKTDVTACETSLSILNDVVYE